MKSPIVRVVIAFGCVAGAVVACGDSASTGQGPGGRNGGADADSGAAVGVDASVAPSDDAGADGSSPQGDAGTVAASCTGRAAQPLDATWTVMSGGTMRTFNVHVPAKYDPARATPVVLNFHGYSSNAAEEDFLALMSQKADKEGFVAVHPEGLGSSWNAGACCGTSAQTGVDDVGFVRAMLDQLGQKLCVDTHRIYATGMSNGGFLSHRLGCELASRIAAVAPVAGVLGVATCAPSRPMPVMHFHGTADTLVPYNGNAAMGFPDVASTFTGWAQRDGCTGQPVESYRKADAHCSTYPACAGGATVTLCTVDGGGHTWPGGTPVPSLGYTTMNVSATDAMWDFFVKHPLP